MILDHLAIVLFLCGCVVCLSLVVLLCFVARSIIIHVAAVCHPQQQAAAAAAAKAAFEREQARFVGDFAETGAR